MKSRIHLLLMILLVVSMAACGGKEETTTPEGSGVTESEKTYLFNLPDTTLKPGASVTVVTPTSPVKVNITEVSDLIVIESVKMTYEEGSGNRPLIEVRGKTPTPCHKVRIRVDEVDAKNNINVSFFSVSSHDQPCVRVYATFSERLFLDISQPGIYGIFVNGKNLGTITIQ